MDSVLVLVERREPGGAVSRTTLELLAVAQRLGNPIALLCGRISADAVELLGGHGARRIVVVAGAESDPDFGSDHGGIEVDAVVELARRLTPVAVLIAAGRAGQVTAARVAVRLEAGIITDVTDVSSGPEGLRAVQETIGGTYLVESVVGNGTTVLTMRADAAHCAPSDDSVNAGAPIIEHIHIESAATARGPRLVSRTPKRAAAPTPLDEADVVVAGGRGVGSAEGFGLLARLAEELGGRLGGTHTAEELGWCPAHARISLPGAQIRPRLYVAGGVSGSVRHRAAIRGARTIVAIDRDPRAPIFRVADFGVIGDLQQVLPALLEEIRERKALNVIEPTVPTDVIEPSERFNRSAEA